ncbi:2-phosphosulfolactate phosphatase [Natronorubrum tibetense]|uniref:2-phosphosulfolactate phosphatase n=1 Tax=Natronorubrum tibetense GA33 TaxID=1114856 RepID=L9VX98_9EURY|nr:2-phosphosulfolactate phosphatase [Natronorubrum tibetense GA33]
MAQIDERFTERMIPSRAQIPAQLETANYVVIDVTHYSNTVLELLRAGATFVHVPDERGDEFAFKDRHSDARIGGGSSENYTPTEGYDFFNSPSYVQRIDVDGRPAAVTSSNGGAAVTDLRKRAERTRDVDVYIGSTMNAKALAAHLREDEKSTITVAAGSKGKPTPEDTIGAVLIHRYLEGDEPTTAELDCYREILTAGKAAKYAAKADIRCRDLLEYSLSFDSRTELPKLDGKRLVDVSGDT